MIRSLLRLRSWARLRAISSGRVTPANVVTYAKDNERVSALITTLATIRETRDLAAAKTEIDRIINDLPYATTETTLGEDGFERRTRSPFGQFGLLLSLVAPPSANGTE